MANLPEWAQSTLINVTHGTAVVPSAEPTRLPMPSDLLESVKSGKCILFLGAMAHAASPPDDCAYSYTNAPPSGASFRLSLRPCATIPTTTRETTSELPSTSNTSKIRIGIPSSGPYSRSSPSKARSPLPRSRLPEGLMRIDRAEVVLKELRDKIEGGCAPV